MGHVLQSKNFGFLNEADPLLAEYGLMAELNAYIDPNTSIIKSRQFAELLAKHIAAHRGLDCGENSFDETLGMLKRQRVITIEVHSGFDLIRLYGNQAAHEHKRDRNAALQSLITAHRLAKWFVQSVLERSNLQIGAFKPLPTPEDATLDLKQEIEFLRRQSADLELASNASESVRLELAEQLQREAMEYQEQLTKQSKQLRQREIELNQLERKSNERIRQIVKVASSKPFQSFLERSEESASRIGQKKDLLPLTQLRIMTGIQSKCCKVPMIITQSSKGGFITQNCPDCGKSDTLKKSVFESLNVYLACPNCRQRTTPEMIGSNYGFLCRNCGWKCELATIVPHWQDVQPFKTDGSKK